jgi:hypothetical protein
MDDQPTWYPLSVDAKSRQRVLDANGREFATGRDMEAAALIVLTMNACVRHDFGKTAGLSGR